jgi:alginate O-acetyltransferase complex protein AlgI
MLFNSFEFALFLPLVFAIHWGIFAKSKGGQNAVLLMASYFFYGWWDYRYLFLMIATSVFDYFLAIGIDRSPTSHQRKLMMGLSLVFNLGVLGTFKYYDFFITSFTTLLTTIGFQANPTTLQLLLPVGVSFYTFQSLSYTIDVYRKEIKASTNIVEFLSFVSFFPQLVAGPIERAANFIPQFRVARKFDLYQGIEGCRFILWGLFKKCVIADNAALIVNNIFGSHETQSGSTLALGAFYFAIQIYGDFSGYSDIAIGSAKLFGVNLMRNFAYPYFSRSVAEFWRRWHISLSTWFKDYIYIPLGGSKGGKWMQVRNTFIIFVVSGLWHGANWTFVIWGLLNAIYFLPLLLLGKHRSYLDVPGQGRILPTFHEFASMVMTFSMCCFAWIFFRSESVTQAIEYIDGIFSPSFFTLPSYLYMVPASILLLIIEWMGRSKWHPIHFENPVKRWVVYALLAFAILLFIPKAESVFIYFQF